MTDRATVGERARSRYWALLAALLGIALISCGSPAHVALHAIDEVATVTPAPIHLPADDTPHDALTEWWYYTGHLTAESGQKYGFEEVIFQVERTGVPVFYAAHFAMTDQLRGEFHFDQRTWVRNERPTSFNLGDGTWQIGGTGASDTLQARMPDYAIDLAFTPAKPPAFHGKNGVISFGAVGDSYYYSTTRARIAGTVVDHGVSVPVTGEAWKDRQWGNFIVTPGGGWDWFSLQLDDGSDVMLFVLHDSAGTNSAAYGTFVDAAGRATPIEPNAVIVKPTATWTSPHTQTTYPSGWRIDFLDRPLQVSLAPTMPDQELDTRPSTGQIYWEGEVGIDGEAGGKPLAGKGYVELTGYSATTPRR